MRVVFLPLCVAGGPAADPARGVLSRAVPRELAARIARAGGAETSFAPVVHMVEGKRLFGVLSERLGPPAIRAILAAGAPADLVVAGDLDPGEPFRLTLALLRPPDLAAAGEESFLAPRPEGFGALESAVRWLATRIELPGPPPADRPARSFDAFLMLLAAREQAAALDGWGETGAAAAAFEAFLAALEAEPEMEAARAELGLFAMTATAAGLAAPDVAAEALARLTESGPRHWPSHAALGQVRALAGDHSGAADAFERAVELMPGRASLRFDLGVALLRAGRAGKAAKALETVRSDPHVGPAALFELGRLRAQKGDPGGALELLLEAAAKGPDLPDLWAALGQAHVARGEFEAAEAAFSRGLAAGPPSPALRRAYGVWLAEEDRFPEAVEQFVELLKLRGDDPLAHLHIGRAHVAAGRRELARHHLRKALRADGEVAEKAKRVLEDVSVVAREEQLLRTLDEAIARPAEEQVPFLESLISEETAFVEARV
ncbi:MAG: tetratricopeptide repeat protein, partial [Planctomycetes bacterium]|nr:tetratricopeptide repeat protein [Planctomycetota bacterium]